MEEGAGLAAARDGACAGAGGCRAGADAGSRGSARLAGNGRVEGGGASKRAAAPCSTESVHKRAKKAARCEENSLGQPTDDAPQSRRTMAFLRNCVRAPPSALTTLWARQHAGRGLQPAVAWAKQVGHRDRLLILHTTW